MHHFVITCQLGLESLVKKEISKLGYEIVSVSDKAIRFQGPIEAIAKVNLWSRFGNIVYLEVGEAFQVTDFDSYFDTIYSINWKQYIPENFAIAVKAFSEKSTLSSISSLQSLSKKAIVKTLVGDGVLREDSDLGILQVQIILKENTLQILLNTSGEGLHKRGYRELTGEAPLKENLAAAIVALSGWRYRDPFHDIFCGSGTIAIEALMIAKNIAPGLKRSFAFENWSWIPKDTLENAKQQAKKQEFSGEYEIYASDIRASVVEGAKRSAKFAQVEDDIEFSVQDYSEAVRKFDGDTHFIVSNPPYGLRLSEDNSEEIHVGLAKIFEKKHILGGIITSDLDFETRSKTKYKKRKLYNGGELCYFYRKI